MWGGLGLELLMAMMLSRMGHPDLVGRGDLALPPTFGPKVLAGMELAGDQVWLGVRTGRESPDLMRFSMWLRA